MYPIDPVKESIDLAKYERMTKVAERPQWFKEALAVPFAEHFIEVNGAKVHTLEYGKAGDKPTLLFSHGNGAHAWWFQAHAALLSGDYHVIVPTFTGMGNSGWRDRYDRDSMAGDILGVVDALGVDKFVYVAHSFGGFISLIFARDHAERMHGLLLCDYVVRPPQEIYEWFADWSYRPTRVYETKEEVMGRFRLAPDQVCANQYLLDFIAERSIRQVEGGWTWLFDPNIYANMRLGTDHEEIFRNMPCPAAALYGQDTVEFERGGLATMAKMMPEQAPVMELADAQHHLMLDQPLAFVAAVDSIARQMLSGSLPVQNSLGK